MPTPPVEVIKPQKSQPVEMIKPPKSQPVEVTKPQKSQPKAVDRPNVPAPAKMAPVPPPVAPVKPSNDVVRDVMKDIELPPDAPKFGDYTRTEKPMKAQLKLPEVPVFSEPEQLIKKEQDLKPQPLLTEDLHKELAEELKKVEKFDLPKPTQAQVLPKPLPQVETKAPSVKAVDATLKIPGMAPGSNAYLGLVRQRISSFWTAPPVDVTGQTYAVVVQFRLYRNGSVTGVAIERSSGNEYYDLAGKRAVLSAIPLPAFPPDLTEPYFDAHFTFTVGTPQG
jgi:TonB family protein